MNKTTKSSMEFEKLAVNTQELSYLLSCGEYSAKKIGEKSGAKLDYGTRRTLWNVKKIQDYLDNIAC